MSNMGLYAQKFKLYSPLFSFAQSERSCVHRMHVFVQNVECKIHRCLIQILTTKGCIEMS